MKPTLCAAPDCTSLARSATGKCSSLCGMHYARMRRHGSLEIPVKVKPQRFCTIDGCENPLLWSGLCRKHLARRERHGDPNTIMRRPSELSPEESLRWSGWDEVEKIAKLGPCWEWRGTIGTNGYGEISFGDTKTRPHRVAFEVWNGPIPEGYLVRHKCDNPPCINPAHLELGTDADNSRDKVTRGRAGALRGEAHLSAKLTEDQVREIRLRYAQGGVTQEMLAAEYGVAKPTIGGITSGRIWKHVSN